MLARRLLVNLALCSLAAGRAAWAQDFTWQPDISPSGPVLVLVSLGREEAWVYRNGIEIGRTRVSTGIAGHPTPTGVFTILSKSVDHHSSIYDEASMPYAERLTWDGVALHAGIVPGYPSSHGCVHLPLDFAKDLYAVTEVGTTVAIFAGNAAPAELYDADLSLGTSGVAAEWRLQPELSPSGPVSLLLSGADRRLYVYRNGVEIGTAEIGLRSPEQPVPTLLFHALEPGPAGAPRWMRVEGEETGAGFLGRIEVPPGFAQQLDPLLTVGTSFYVTPAPAGPGSRTGPGFTVVATRPA